MIYNVYNVQIVKHLIVQHISTSNYTQRYVQYVWVVIIIRVFIFMSMFTVDATDEEVDGRFLVFHFSGHYSLLNKICSGI
jgi:hypothetical protein